MRPSEDSEGVTETASGRQRQTGRTGVFGTLCSMVFLVNPGRVISTPLLEPFRTTGGASAATGRLPRSVNS
ncbi:hypothetical protein [Natrinema sp. SYSU A 869]|uniref:hypothetical protein n=1 Tax=Natrinema sp. SYSU A 869 TaxID=2871694 RepID=UPI001CA3CF5B|nr:hypothetical protein [Natrinema sp. SYSU A 869]